MRRTYGKNFFIILFALILTCQAAAPVYAKISWTKLKKINQKAGASSQLPVETTNGFNYMMPPAYAWQPEMVSGSFNERREEGLEMSGMIPEVSADYGHAASFLNDMIDSAIAGRIREAKDSRARSITFNYEVHSDTRVVSIVLLSTVTSATPKTVVDSVNFDPATGVPVGLTDAVGFDVAPLASKILRERIRGNPQNYNAGLDTGRIAGRPFYLENGLAVILFDEYELSATAGGENELLLDLSRISQVSISRADYRMNSGYNIKMIPLALVCGGLGYTVDEGLEAVTVSRDGMTVSELIPGVNNYVEYGRRVRTLEAPPELVNGLPPVYVPISFFDQILSWITYTIDSEDNITFYSYQE